MPIYYICSNCGHRLFVFQKVGQDFYGVRTPSEVKLQFGGKCPRCGHVMGTPDLQDIEIRPKVKVPEAWKRWTPRPA